MPTSPPLDASHPVTWSLVAAGLVTLIAALAGIILFLAASLVLSVDLGLGRPANLSLPADLMARGPLGWAAWMALLGTCGAPFLGAGVFTLLYFGRKHAN